MATIVTRDGVVALTAPTGPQGPLGRVGVRLVGSPDRLHRALPRPLRQAVHADAPGRTAVRDALRPGTDPGGVHGQAGRASPGGGREGPRAGRGAPLGY